MARAAGLLRRPTPPPLGCPFGNNLGIAVFKSLTMNLYTSPMGERGTFTAGSASIDLVRNGNSPYMRTSLKYAHRRNACASPKTLFFTVSSIDMAVTFSNTWLHLFTIEKSPDQTLSTPQKP